MSGQVAPGQWCFPVNITPTAFVGGCGSLPPPIDFDAVGAAGGGAYPLTRGTTPGWVGTVSHAGGIWRLVLNVGPFGQWVPTNIPLTWSIVRKRFEATASTNCGPGFACTLTYDVWWKPEMIAGTTWRRGPVDEITPDLGHVLRWYHEDLDLPGSVAACGAGGDELWGKQHVRGLTRKYGTVALPPDFSPRTWWTF